VASLFRTLRRLIVRTQVALFTAAGITVLMGGLLTYDATAGVLATPGPTATPTATEEASTTPTPFPSIGPVLPTPTPAPTGFASRIVIPALDIDLPVVQAPQGFPYCNVAQYVKEFSQPGQPGSTVIGAHARKGMFLPIHDAAMVNGGAAMIGMLVLVYTNDNRLYLYEIDLVRRQQTNYDIVALPPGVTQQLVITTSEDGRDDPHKIMVRARHLYDTAADPKRANPPAHIVVCS
jgi:sortase (surface protein transpeptidase)